MAMIDDRDALPEWAEPLPPRERMEAYEAQVARAAAQERVAREVGWTESMNSLLAMAARARDEASRLPCFAAMTAEDGPRIGEAVEACRAAAARATCPRWTSQPPDPNCAWRRERALVEAYAVHLFECRIAGAIAHDGGNELLRKLRSGWLGTRRDLKPSAAELLFSCRPHRRNAQGVGLPALPLDPKPPLAVVQAFMARTPWSAPDGRAFTGAEWGLILGGLGSTGKTVAACSPAIDRRLLFVAAPELCGKDPVVDFERAAGAQLLVIDDLGTERNTATSTASTDTLAALLTERHRHRRLTIVTTNLTAQRRAKDDPPGLLERYGERLFDPQRGRVREGLALVGFQGESLR